MISNQATRHFIDIQPGTDPSDVSWYANTINTRQFTLANITTLCRLTTDLSHYGVPHIML